MLTILCRKSPTSIYRRTAPGRGSLAHTGGPDRAYVFLRRDSSSNAEACVNYDRVPHGSSSSAALATLCCAVGGVCCTVLPASHPRWPGFSDVLGMGTGGAYWLAGWLLMCAGVPSISREEETGRYHALSSYSTCVHLAG